MTDILLNTSSCKSIIHCGDGAFAKYAPLLGGQKFLVTDTNVNAIYGKLIKEYFVGCGLYVLPAGEKSKTFRYLSDILAAMADAELNRSCTVIAFGGGVVGDIAGLAASLYMRGVNTVQIPTTLLSQVDSSVGGKTAVDFKNIKNLVGTFYQPSEVIVDPLFLKTLPPREIRCGLGEIIKYAALDKVVYSKLLKEANIFSLDFLGSIVPDCIRHKVCVVSVDERDVNGIRKTLNLGHTTGHAAELYYRRKSHGEFVLIGMYYELHIAEKLKMGDGKYYDRLRQLIERAVKIPAYTDIEKAAGLAKMDKKNTDESISLIVPTSEGESTELKLSFDEYVRLLKEVNQ